MGIVDQIVEEPLGGAHRAPQETANNIKSMIIKYLRFFDNTPLDELLKLRYKKYRNMGKFKEE